jgi:hypothetical protein
MTYGPVGVRNFFRPGSGCEGLNQPPTARRRPDERASYSHSSNDNNDFHVRPGTATVPVASSFGPLGSQFKSGRDARAPNGADNELSNLQQWIQDATENLECPGIVSTNQNCMRLTGRGPCCHRRARGKGQAAFGGRFAKANARAFAGLREP